MSTPSHQAGPRRRSRTKANLWTGIVLFAAWIAFQILLTLVIATSSENPTFDCTLDIPRAALIAATAVGAVCLAGAGLLLVRSRVLAAVAALGIGIAAAITWIAIGGFGDFSCVVGV